MTFNQTLEKIQYESLNKQKKYVEAFERLGYFKTIEEYVNIFKLIISLYYQHLKSNKKIYDNFIENMKDREEDI